MDVAAADGGGVGNKPTGLNVPEIPANVGFNITKYRGAVGEVCTNWAVHVDRREGKG